MENPFLRTQMLIGQDKLEILNKSHIAVFGVGGVGSFAVEVLARAGVGYIDIFDGDKVDATNINRQLIAMASTVGMNKTEVMKSRILEINPFAHVGAHNVVFDSSNYKNFSFELYDYILDAIDTTTSKILIITEAQKLGKKVISSMGMGNRIDPTKIELADIYSTSVCPLARVMRRELKRQGVKSLKVVYSKEPPMYVPRNKINASISFMPSVAGLIMASEVVRDLIKVK